MKNLRCPFCGGMLLLRQFDGYEGYDTYYVGELEDELDKKIDTIPCCSRCDCELGICTSAREAIETWNRRA